MVRIGDFGLVSGLLVFQGIWFSIMIVVLDGVEDVFCGYQWRYRYKQVDF